ncbi:hypothetical protein AOLI_G00169370 [Acnodon oligacanthus]
MRQDLSLLRGILSHRRSPSTVKRLNELREHWALDSAKQQMLDRLPRSMKGERWKKSPTKGVLEVLCSREQTRPAVMAGGMGKYHQLAAISIFTPQYHRGQQRRRIAPWETSSPAE